jgi:tetratricopeptide (TPR) repeat protein
VRKTVAIGVGLIALAGLLPPAAGAEGIQWHKSLDEALKASKESGKLVMLTLHTDWCGYCTMLKEQTWPAEAVIGKSAEFECVAVDPEKTEGNDQYDDGSYPRTLFLRADGEVVNEIGGFLPPDEFVAEMGRAQGNLAKLKEAEEITKQLAKPEDDLALALKAGVLYAEIGRVKEAIHWLAPAYEGRGTLPESDRGEVALAYGLGLSMDLQYEKSLPVLQAFVEGFPAHERVRDARFAIGMGLLKTDKLTEARDVWQKLAEEKPDDWIGEASAHNVEVVNQALKGQ